MLVSLDLKTVKYPNESQFDCASMQFPIGGVNTIHSLVRYEVIRTGIMRKTAHPALMILTSSLSVMYLPSFTGMFSGRMFAVTGFQSYMNINSGTINSTAENIYKYPASFSQEFPLYSNHVGTLDITK